MYYMTLEGVIKEFSKQLCLFIDKKLGTGSPLIAQILDAATIVLLGESC